MAPKKHNYDESKIKTLSSLEHIRTRTGMYIGRLGDGSHYDDGIYVLVKEVVDNAVDEFIMGYGRQVDVSLNDGQVRVRDHGRGIPLGKVIDCVSRINTGAKYNDDVFQFSVGLNGVGTKAVNALSERFIVTSYRDSQFFRAEFTRGELKSQKRGKQNADDGTEIEFEPDPAIFKSFRFRDEYLLRRFRLYTYLNAGLKINFNGTVFSSENGLKDLLDEDIGEEALYPILHSREKMIEIAFTHTNRLAEDHYSFVNGQYTSDGGTHLSAFREGILKAINDVAKAKFEGDDVREGLVGAIAIRLKDPVFESQTKNKLGNTEIRTELVAKVREIVSTLLHKNSESTERLLQKVQETQRLRRELQDVRKLARERSAAISIRIPQLKDCKVHLNLEKGTGKESMIFITEGMSAAGSITSCRDPNVQAVFTLKGKPLNVWDLNRTIVYKNDEIFNLMRTLNVEENLQNLRYGKVILATDADVDGLHIRNLLITCFLRFFPDLVTAGYVFILETPLFRVRDKRQTFYCYSEAERDEAIRKIRNAEVTRFKGLGEISPSEFKAFIGAGMKLTQVTVDDGHAVQPLLQFYMGKNTPARREFIMDHLVVEEPFVA
ncbi:MAG: type IIA DNA topoisomerase subunit B [Verrucomicrobia bacterium]|nr:type IIA DNA topoisomerase subunit B [Verrucomicrobiota bacterium]